MPLAVMETESTWYGRVLTKHETYFVLWCGDERQGIALAKFAPELPENPSAEQVQNAVILAMLRVKEIAEGVTVHVQYMGGHRRDDWRAM